MLLRQSLSLSGRALAASATQTRRQCSRPQKRLPHPTTQRSGGRPSCTMCSAAAAASSSGEGNAADVQRERAEALKSVMANSKALPIAVGVIVAVRTFLQRATPPEFRGNRGPVKGAMKTFRMAAAVVPFASMGIGGTTFLVTKAVGSFLNTYLLLLFLRVLLSWFPAFNWERQPWLTLRQMTDPYLQLFRGLIPPLLGMIDFTPLLGFFILQWIHGELASATMEDDIEEYW